MSKSECSYFFGMITILRKIIVHSNKCEDNYNFKIVRQTSKNKSAGKRTI